MGIDIMISKDSAIHAREVKKGWERYRNVSIKT